MESMANANQASDVDTSLISEEVMKLLNEIKMETKNDLLRLYKLKTESGESARRLPHDLIDVLDVGHPTEMTVDDMTKIFNVVSSNQTCLHL